MADEADTYLAACDQRDQLGKELQNAMARMLPFVRALADNPSAVKVNSDTGTQTNLIQLSSGEGFLPRAGWLSMDDLGTMMTNFGRAKHAADEIYRKFSPSMQKLVQKC